MKILFLFVIIQLTAVAGFAQNDFAVVKAGAGACEINSSHLDRLRYEMANSPMARVVAKFYAGKTESSSVGEKRTNYIRTFLQQNKGFDLSRMEFVDAGKLETDENPKTEFYLAQAGEPEGKLFLVTYSSPNKSPCLDCCDGDFTPKNINAKPKAKIIKKKTTKRQKKRGK